MRKQRGNILFLILLAVVLFAALSYAVTSGMRGGGTDAKPEKAKADAAALLQYAQSVRTAIGRMKITNGCKDEQISFDYRNSSTECLTSETPLTGYENPNSPTNCQCHVFHTLGGGIEWRAPADLPHAKYGGVYANLYGGTSAVPFIGINGKSELYLINWVSFPTGAPTDAAKAFCNAYNELSGNPNYSLTNGVWGIAGNKFAGTFTDSGSPVVANFDHKPSACYLYNDNNSYNFYFVLIER